jgi:MarR family transcriptional regulator, negative regulator of the multidrug operon emrRAB
MDKSPLVLLELVERLANLMRAELRRAAPGESLQAVHFQALTYLARANRYSNTPQAIAQYLALSKGTISQTLLLLDRRGLIERYQDDLDRRVVRLRLSPQGEQALYDGQPTLAWQNATRNVSPNRIRNAVTALREALDQLREDGHAASFGRCGTCHHCRRLSARAHQCSLMGDRLSGPELRKICWLHVPKS